MLEPPPTSRPGKLCYSIISLLGVVALFGGGSAFVFWGHAIPTMITLASPHEMAVCVCVDAHVFTGNAPGSAPPDSCRCVIDLNVTYLQDGNRTGMGTMIYFPEFLFGACHSAGKGEGVARSDCGSCANFLPFNCCYSANDKARLFQDKSELKYEGGSQLALDIAFSICGLGVVFGFIAITVPGWRPN